MCENLKNRKVKFQEIKIPVSYGHISGKWWGNLEIKPIICLHGHQDNCGSFNRLIPLLNNKVSFLAIDLPGHGYSSRIPSEMIYGMDGIVNVITMIKNHFKWKTVALMGHSMGGTICFLYTMFHPKNVDFLICLNSPFFVPFDMYFEYAVIHFLNFEKYSNFEKPNRKTVRPTYTKAEMIEKQFEDYQGSLDRQHVWMLLERNLRESQKTKGKYYLSNDPRLKVCQAFPFAPQQFPDFIRKISCPVFTLEAKDESEKLKKTFDEIHEVLKEKSEEFGHEIYKLSKGTHHAHINEPEVVAGLLNDFLDRRLLGKKAHL